MEHYARRFQKLLRKLNGNREETTVPNVLQVRMFIYGLTPLLVPLVASQDPGTLNNAIERAKVVETSYNYIPNSTFTSEPSEKKVDGLAEQVQKLTLNYTDLTTALLAKLANQTNEPNSRRNNNNNNNNRPPIKCYKCGKLGHIARNCRSTQRNQSGPSNARSFNNQGNQNRWQSCRINYLNQDEIANSSGFLDC